MKKLLAAAAVTAMFASTGLASVATGGETRSISLYHIHTGESLTVTYMKDGQYVPSAIQQINRLLRDWRRNEVTRIDPRSIDLVWELHEELGSHAPIHIVCGYRSASTNAFLHRIGRHVAKESQHIQGKAIDFYFPDVPTEKIRNVALVHQVGGVGYYRSAGGPTGFLHVDSGHVRHWGPAISSSQMAQIMESNRHYLRAHKHQDATANFAVASNNPKASPFGPISRLFGLDKSAAPPAPAQVAAATPQPVDAAAQSAYKAGSEDLADLSQDAAGPATPAKPAPTITQVQMASLGDLTLGASQTGAKPKAQAPAAVADAEIKSGRVIPKPRLKPTEFVMAAAATAKQLEVIRINAASAPPPSQNGRDAPAPMAGSLGTLIEAVAIDNTNVQHSAAGKGDLATEIRNGTAKGVPVIKPILASAAKMDLNWWSTPDANTRRNGQPPVIGSVNEDVMPKEALLPPVRTKEANAKGLRAADGKSDLVEESFTKGDLKR